VVAKFYTAKALAPVQKEIKKTTEKIGIKLSPWRRT
jgi:hypothetical protein